MLSKLRHWWDTSFAIEIILLLLAAPALFMPGAFPAWASLASLGLLAAGWLWRRLRLGHWLSPTPVTIPLFFLFGIMLPVSLWAAPPSLRLQYSIPNAYILLWSFALFWVIVVHGRRKSQLLWLSLLGFLLAGMAVAAVSLIATQFPAKLPLISPLIEQLPQRLLSLRGAEGGINANQVGGAMVLALPLALASLAGELLGRRRLLILLAALAAVLAAGFILVAAQSRFSLLGAGVATAFLLLFPWRWGRWAFITALAVTLLSLPYLPWDTLLDGGTSLEEFGTLTLAGRQEIWSRALYGIQDFSFTGMGLNTFRSIVHLLYPLFTISPDMDLGHAHNFFLQVALDFGLPGLIAMLAIFLGGGWQMWRIWRTHPQRSIRFLALGVMATLIGTSAQGMGDAVAPGTQASFLLWWALALGLAIPGVNEGTAAEISPQAGSSPTAPAETDAGVQAA